MEGIRPALAVWLGLVICASAQTTPASVGAALPQPAREIPLYPGAAPGSEKWDWAERSVTTPTGLPMVQDVVRPVSLHYPADRDKAVGTAMIVVPGGGFRTLMMSYEGVDIARRLNAMGIDAFVLKYRLLYTGPGAPSGPASGAAGAGQPKTFSLAGAYKAQAGQDLIALAVDDGRQAVRLVRERAGELGVRPDRIGMMGFSDGWAVMWCPRYGFPETAIQAICGAHLWRLGAYYMAGRLFWLKDRGLSGFAERLLPFTEVCTCFQGDRYGELGPDYPDTADYVCQARLEMRFEDKLAPGGLHGVEESDRTVEECPSR